MIMKAKKFYNIKEIADLTLFKEHTVRQWIKCGDLRARKAGGQWRVTKGDLTKLIRSWLSNK